MILPGLKESSSTMKNTVGLILLALLTLPGCGEGPNACNEGNFCSIAESGSAACVDGYEWLNPSASGDYRCIEIPGLPVLGEGNNTLASVNLTVVGNSSDGLNVPRDLGFHPTVPGQLWVVNRADDSIVIFSNMGRDGETTSIKKRDIFDGGSHFLAEPSAIAFGANGNFSTIHETDKETQGPVSQGGSPFDFMGPTMWSSDLNIFNGGHSGHLDMMHNSPLGMGIAWEKDNVYWVFDGYHSSLTRYDFVEDHGPGGTIHDDGIVSRHVQGNVKRVADVVSHLEVDQSSNLLYIADTGNNRIATLDITSGTRGADMPLSENYDCYNVCPDYHFVDGVTFNTFVNGPSHNMTQPSGLAIFEGNIYVSDFASGRIYAFSPEGKQLDYLETGRTSALGGMEFDTDGSLYVVDTVTNEILRIQSL
jgi:hypothetical protein